MAASTRPLALLLALIALCVLPSGAAAGDDDFADPIGDMPMYAVDLGKTTVLDGGDTLAVETAMVPRPPAGWGGCAYSVGSACIPAEMSVTWYLDHAPGGNPADDGADVKLTVVPERGLSFWTSERWNGDRYLPGPRPLGSEAADSLRWSARLSDLGIEGRPATARMWVVSSFRSPPGIGTPLDLEDRAGPGTVVLGAPSADAAAAACDRRASTSRRPQRRLLRAHASAARVSAERRNAAVAPGRALGPGRRGCA